VHGHLVAVEVGVEGRAGERVQLDGAALDQHDLEGLNAQAVQRRRAVEQHRALVADLSSTSHTSGDMRSTMRLALLMLCAKLFSTNRRMTKGLKSSSAIFLGRPHWCSLSVGPITMTERPE
jgi:hypothetical protein